MMRYSQEELAREAEEDRRFEEVHDPKKKERRIAFENRVCFYGGVSLLVIIVALVFEAIKNGTFWVWFSFIIFIVFCELFLFFQKKKTLDTDQ